MVVWNCNGGTGVVYYAESTMVSHIAPEVDSSEAAYPPPRSATRVGVPYSIFPRYFKKRRFTWMRATNYNENCIALH